MKNNSSKGILESVKVVSDEAKLQGHLLGLELKEQVGMLKKDKAILEKNLKPILPVMSRAVGQIQVGLKPVAKSLLASYIKIKTEISELYANKR